MHIYLLRMLLLTASSLIGCAGAQVIACWWLILVANMVVIDAFRKIVFFTSIEHSQLIDTMTTSAKSIWSWKSEFCNLEQNLLKYVKYNSHSFVLTIKQMGYQMHFLHGTLLHYFGFGSHAFFIWYSIVTCVNVHAKMHRIWITNIVYAFNANMSSFFALTILRNYFGS